MTNAIDYQALQEATLRQLVAARIEAGRRVTSVRLRREGVEHDPHARVVVSVKRGDEWADVMSEPVSACFDHIVAIG